MFTASRCSRKSKHSISSFLFSPISLLPLANFNYLQHHFSLNFISVPMTMQAKRFKTKKRKTQDPLELDIARLTKNLCQPAPPPPFTFLQEVVVHITSLSFTGEGIGTVDKTWMVVVPFTLPGEKVIAKVYRNYSTHSLADLVEVIEKAENRIQPKCLYFGSCSGCQLQHLTYEDQLEFKKKVVQDSFFPLKAQGLLSVNVMNVVGSPLEFQYRTKLTPHFHKPKAVTEGDKVHHEVHIGFSEKGRSRVIDIEDCPIATDSINKRLPSLRKEVANNAENYKLGATLLIRETTTAEQEKQTITSHRDIVTDYVNGIKFDYPAGSFFQNNNSILPLLTQFVSDELGQECKFLVDTYCGSGLFSICCSSKFEKVLGIEISPESIQWASHNAQQNNITHCEFTLGSSEEIFKNISVSGNETGVIMDPPRKGSSHSFLDQLISFAPRKIVYVSCNVHSQVRDLEYFFSKTSDYCITAVCPFDLFPQTNKIESVVTLNRKASDQLN